MTLSKPGKITEKALADRRPGDKEVRRKKNNLVSLTDPVIMSNPFKLFAMFYIWQGRERKGRE